MSRKRIACDIDGVVADFLAGAVKYWGEPQIPVAYSLEEMFPNVPEKELLTWIGLSSTYTELPLVEGAVGAIAQLRRRYNIIFLTSRPPFTEGVTQSWLARHGLRGHGLVITYDKLAVIEQRGIQIAVEDRLETARVLAGTCQRVFLMDQPYNSGPCGRAMRVNGWNEIVNLLGG